MSANRSVFRHAQLRRLIAPSSIAIVGVSPRPTSFGMLTLQNSRGYEGRIHLVNAKYDSIDGRPCHAAIKDLPEVPDCVVIVLPRDAVEPVMLECAQAGVGGAVIYASGYAETAKPEYVAMQSRLSAIAREANIRIAGPNCVGVSNHSIRMALTFASDFAVSPAGPGSVGLVSQSGGVGNGITQGVHLGTRFSHTLTVGNSCDIDVADYVAYLAEDPHCSAIACVFEGVEDPRRFIEAAEIAWSANKPLVVFKMGSGEGGAAAALSHSGFLAGSHAAYVSALERAGVIVSRNFTAFMETASFLAKAGTPRGRGPAVMTMSGGYGVLSADVADSLGVALPQPQGRTLERLRQSVPEYGALRNPCDVTAQAANEPDILYESTRALLDDDTYSSLVFLHAYAYPRMNERLNVVRDIARERGKLLVICWLSGWTHGPGAVDMAGDPGVGLFRSIESCMEALAGWHWREDYRRQWLAEQGQKATRLSPADAGDRARRLLGSLQGRIVTERDAKTILKLYGLPVVEECLVDSADAACQAAARLSYPVALKVESPDLPHKTEAGAVRLDLRTEAEVRAAHAEILRNARKAGAKQIAGVLVQPMVRGDLELMLGARHDPQFGPLVVAGFGGTLVELLKDTAVARAPVTPSEAARMLGGLRASRLFSGYRGKAPVDLQQLAGIVSRFSELLADLGDVIEEADVNPLICSGSSIMAVDALFVTAGADKR